MRRTLVCLAVLLLPASLAGQAPKREHTITIDDYFSQANLFESVISPDGLSIAYTEGRWQKTSNDRKADLWVVGTQSRKVQRLTFDRAGDWSPRWSPDSQWIYFLSRRKKEGEKNPPRDGSAQVWRIRRTGGEPFAVTRVSGGVTAFALASDGKSLLYQTAKDTVRGEWAALKRQFDKVDYGHGKVPLSQIWKLDLETWRAELLIDSQRVIRDFALASNGRIAMITTPDDKVVSFEGQSRVEVWDPKTKKITVVPEKPYRADAASPYGWLEHLAWNADGSAVAFNVIFDAYPAEIFIARLQDDRWRTDRMPRFGQHIHGYGSPIAWRGKSELFFLQESKARVRLCSLDLAGGNRESAVKTHTPGDVVVENFSLDARGERLAVVLNDTTHLPDLYTINYSKPPARLTNLNPQVDTWKLPQISVVRWKGAGGDMVEGILELPPDYRPESGPLPLVVEIHGGPTTATRFHLQYWIYGRTLFPARGYALLSPNYRGSVGYGDKFLTDLVGKENDIDVADILAGVDFLIEKGIADPKRLGVMGWSNGGYLTNCIITKTTRFKAASSGAGIVDTVMEWGSNDEPAYAMVFKKGFPWNQSQL
jgi:dipeptidyl aminopeptidase/acylaminoacyl peptidase